LKAPVTVSLARSGSPDQHLIEEAVAVLRKGALIILPTETVYGLAADSRHPEAERRLCQAKKRSESKPITLLAADYTQINQMGAEFGDIERELARQFWPGPLTLVLSIGNRFEGFRIPDHPVTLAVLRTAGNPLRVTSANLSGEPPALTAESAVEALRDSVELVLDAGPVQCGVPSTVVKIDSETFEVLRDGAVPGCKIATCCRKMGLKNL